jgi:glycosyltransferase involved in cell wall biosynthesis
LATNAAVLCTEHEVPLIGSKEYTSRERLGRRGMLWLTHAMVAVSRRNARLRFQRMGARGGRFAVVLNGVPIREVSPNIRAQNRAGVRDELLIPSGAVVCGCVARLTIDKGLNDLLNAFARVQANPPAFLVLVGDGPIREELERLAQHHDIADRVRFVGYRSDPGPYLDAFDIFALTVPSGSMSIALLEAMARGLPALITFCGPEEAVVHDQTGLCAPPLDAEAITGELQKLIGDQDLRVRLGREAVNRVRTDFATARVADDLLELYEGARAASIPARLRAV